MRRALLLFLLVACAHQAPQVVQPTPEAVEPTTATQLPPPPPQWVIADQGKEVLSLGKDTVGTIVDGVRVIVQGSRLTPAKDVSDPPLVAAHSSPSLKGFLFRSNTALYTAERFDGPLKPLVSFPSPIDDLRFGPTYILVHAASGQTWSIDPKTGARTAPSPLGVVDVQTLADGRAAAITEIGAVWVTADGAKWTDVTNQLQGQTDELRLTDEGRELWIVARAGASARVDPGGRLAFIDHVPEVKPTSLRPRDPRWRSSESPARRALQAGVLDGDRVAVVVEGGSVARVDVLSGELVSFGVGRFPPDATCEGVRTADDVVFACVKRGGGFVMSHVLGDKSAITEQTFTAPGTFFASDDGGLAYGGPCSGQRAGSFVCVRVGAGSWQELEIDGSQADGGANPGEITRWIPRADGGVYGLSAGSIPALWDARAGTYRVLTGDPIASTYSPGRYPRRTAPSPSGKVVDRMWSSTSSGVLRGWADNGLGAFEIRTDGQVVASPFHFEHAQTAGPFALARSQGRLWQTTDRGAAWTEVDLPPLAGPKLDLDVRACSPLGCDLGSWFRVGWFPAPPEVKPAMTIAPGAPRIDPAPLPQLACKPQGAPTVSAATRSSENSPDDLGIGNAKVAVASANGDISYVHTVFGHVTINPPHGENGTPPDRDEFALRMLVHGYATDTNNGQITVLGPVKDPLQLRRSAGFVAPFDPFATVRRGSYGNSELIAAAKLVGMTSADVLTDDLTVPTLVIPALAADLGDLVFTNDLGLLGVARASGRVKVTVRPAPQDSQFVTSAAAIGDDEVLLELDGEGVGHVSRWSGSAITPLFDVPAPLNPDRYPANPDAIAVNAKGEIAVLRTPSGAEPPSTSLPALLYVHGQGLQALAPWSTLTPGDDPACKADPGYRAILHTIKPWLKVRADLTEPEARMVARVKWSSARVCLEAVELRAPDVKLNVLRRGDDPNEKAYSENLAVESHLVARLSGGAAAARAAIGLGVEWRQTESCALQPP